MSAIRLFGGVLAAVLAAVLALAPGAVLGQRASAPTAPPSSAPPAKQGEGGASQTLGADDVATILWIDDLNVTRPMLQRIWTHFRDAVSENAGRRTTFHVESLELDFLPSASRRAVLEARLVEDYAREPIDLIIAFGDSSVAVATRVRAVWGRDIPIIGMYTGSAFLSSTAKLPALPNGVQAQLSDMNSATARNMRALLPGLNEVLIVGSTAMEVNSAAASMRPILGDGVRVQGIASPTHGELQQRFALLGDKAAIVYLSVWYDSQGRVWQIREYLRELLKIAPRPVFGWLGTYLGLGIVGGPVFDGSEIGMALARVATDLLKGADPSAITPVIINDVHSTYDWEPLQRFGIPLGRLPDGATVLNRPLPVWESYPRTSIAVSAFIVALLVSIGALVFSGRRVRAANAAQLAMSRRLLRTQDEERVRIARDLHDDLCQQMAMLAIDVDGAPTGTLAPATVADRLHRLIDRARSIAVGLHATHIGSMPFREAVASHASSVQARTGLDIRVHTARWEGEPPAPVALALFRAVQEALQNAIRHADAAHVSVTMTASNGTIRIEVTDDGIGFEPAHLGRVGLGLTSMAERMATINGTFSIRSEPFGGTTVNLSAPFHEATKRAGVGVVQGVPI